MICDRYGVVKKNTSFGTTKFSRMHHFIHHCTFKVHQGDDRAVDDHPLQISMSSSRPSDSAATLDAADDDRNRNPASLALFLTEASCWDFLQ